MSDCTPTNALPLVTTMTEDDTIIGNDGGPGVGATVQFSRSAIFVPPEMVVFETSGAFQIGDFPGATAVRVRCVGGGGAGGGAASTSAGEASGGGGGGGGGYAESVLLASALAASETVTVGAGATGGTGTGSSGGASSFGAHVSAAGGQGGDVLGPASGASAANGGPGGIGTAGQVLVHGDDGGSFAVHYAHASLILPTNDGGGTPLGGSARKVGAFKAAGSSGSAFGAGGSGASNDQNGTANAGGDGADGVVIVEVFF